MTTVTSENGYRVVIEQAPVPASRPRVSKWGVYYSDTYKKWKAAAARDFPTGPIMVLKGPLAVTLEVVCKRPQKLTSSIPVGDVDNYAKAALDAVNDAGLWDDDKQVVSLRVSKRYAEPGEAPHTLIDIQGV